MSKLVHDLMPQSRFVRSVGDLTKDGETIWIVEEAAGHLRSRVGKGPSPQLHLYRLRNGVLMSAGHADLISGGKRPEAVMSLLRDANATEGIVVCSYRTAPANRLAKLLEAHGRLRYVLEVASVSRLRFDRARNGERTVAPKIRAEEASWKPVKLHQPAGSSYGFAANLGSVALGEIGSLVCFALSFGRISGYQRGVLVGVSSLTLDDKLSKLVQLLAWTRWIRVVVRRATRLTNESAGDGDGLAASTSKQEVPALKVRANRRVASELDLRVAQERMLLPIQSCQLKRRLTRGKKILNVVELFAGAGGMGLGFLNARSSDGRGYRITGSAEIHPIYTQTLKQNHRYMESAGLVPRGSTPKECAPIDLCSPSARARLAEMTGGSSKVDIVIGGPPCQGFSSANRNSWSSSNPNNRLVDAFMDSVSLLRPKVLLMENVQGILWTPRNGGSSSPSVASHVLSRLRSMGYLVFPKLLDAAWYGAPQNRNRFFLLGLHQDLGYRDDDFGCWGPFPRPTHGPGTNNKFVTVRDAIRDLPRLVNGDNAVEIAYNVDLSQLNQNQFLKLMRTGAPPGVIWDHVTSKHADYVIDRYKLIPQGQNWEAVRHLMTNYADVDRTHSNIYRRLAWSESAITMGHYRKSMIIHPSQNRGLSLREASRLQTFPDWFRFAGSLDGSVKGGLIHKQQQLANAVCPSVTRAVADFILEL